jgi:hypothetical protein
VNGADKPVGPQGNPGAAGPAQPAGQNAPNTTPNTVVIGTASVPGVKGENADGSFNVQSYSEGVSNPSSVGTLGGRSRGGKTTLSGFTITKVVDKATPQLTHIAYTGSHVSALTITIQSPGSQTPTVYTLNTAM